MFGLRQVASVCVRFMKFLLVNVTIGWLTDLLIFDRLNEAINGLFSSRDELENGAVGIEAEGTAGTSGGVIGRRGALKKMC